jgi:Holliday junction resolvase
MAKTLLEVFTNDKPSKRKPSRNARAKGGRAEAMLVTKLAQQGYEARRTHLSAFPDIIAWNEDQFLLIEVKARGSKSGVSNAVSLFRASVKTLAKIPSSRMKARLLCLVLFSGEWQVYEYIDGDTSRGLPFLV